MRRTDLVRLGGAFVAYCAVTAGLFRALLAHPAATLPHDAGDPVLSTWILWWNAHCVPLTRAWWDGLSFYPGHGALALSDHRLGLGLIATPVQWLGGSAVLAHNAAFLLSFPLCAIAAYALTWSLTRHAGAAFVSGLVFGFSPYRVSHLEHLELLSAYWLPVALFAAHRFLDRPSPASLAVFVAAWVMQALCSSYYVLYAAPLLALWIWWFARADAGGRRSAALVAALAVGSAALIPVAAGFLNVHHALGLTRSISEIDAFSADISSVGSASPLLAVWHSSIPATQERAIFPGAVPVGLVLAAALAGRSRRKAVARPRGVTIALGGAGLVVLAAGIAAAARPWNVHVGPMTIAATSATKPATEALALLVLAALSTRTFTAAYRSRSPFAFYAGATILMWMCALGPHPTLFDKPALYRGPYALLMWLPGYDTGLRAPARFTMMTVLTLGVAAGLAVERIVRAASPATQRAFVVICTAGIVLDGLVWRVPVVNVPPRDTVPEPARRAAAVLELPADGAGRDIAAVMRTIGYHRPVVNGYSGYLPPHYRTFQTALDRHDVTVLGALARFGPIAIAVDRNGDHAAWKSFLDTVPTIAPAGNTPLHEWMLLPETTGPPEHDGRPLAIKHVSASGTARDVTALAYGGSRWTLARPQRGDELLEIELEDARDAATVLVGTGREFECWPRALAISTSVEGRTWSDAWQGNAGGAAFLATLAAPRWPLLRFSFTPRRARFVRIHQTAHDDTYPWIVHSIAVLAP